MIFILLLSSVLATPFLIIPSFLYKKYFPAYYWVLKNIWANLFFFISGYFVKTKWFDNKRFTGQCILVANHTSFLDFIMLYKVSHNPMLFIGKKELERIPLFGYYYKRSSILVDRKNLKSKYGAYASAKQQLEKGHSITIFPEGSVPKKDVTLGDFKDGAFRLAIEYGIPILPVVFPNNKSKLAYEMGDGASLGFVKMNILSPIKTKHLTLNDKNILKTKTRGLILATLEQNKKLKNT